RQGLRRTDLDRDHRSTHGAPCNGDIGADGRGRVALHSSATGGTEMVDTVRAAFEEAAMSIEEQARAETVQALLVARLAEALKLSPDAIDVDESLAAYGL